jgi:hypothetical protein
VLRRTGYEVTPIKQFNQALLELPRPPV